MKIAGVLIPSRMGISYALSLSSIVLCWPFTFFAAGMSSHGAVTASEMQTATYIAAALCLWPVLPLVGVPGSYFAFKKEWVALSYVLAGIAVLPFVVLSIFLVVIILSGFGIIN